MATTIRIKRTNGIARPTLAEGELAYVGGVNFSDGERLYVGSPGGATAGGTVLSVGGAFYTRMMDHTPGILTQDAAVIVDASKKINEFYVDDLMLDNNQITTAAGNLVLDSAAGTLQVNDNINVTGVATITGATSLLSTLNVTDATTLQSTLGVTGATTLNNTLQVVGATTMDSTLSVTGATTLNNTLQVVGATTMDSTLHVKADTTMDTSLTVLRDATIDAVTIGLDTVAEISTVSGSGNALTLDSDLGETIVDDNLQVTGNAQLDANVQVNGNVDIDGDLVVDTNTVLGVSSAETIVANAYWNSSLIPSVNDTWDLGSDSNRWSSLYAENVVFGDIQIAVTTDNTIDTASMDLIIDSATGNTIINDNLQVNSGTLTDINMHTQVTSLDVEDINPNEINWAGTNGRVTGSVNFRWFESSTILLVDDLRLDNNKVFTNAGNLVLDSSTGITQVDDNFDVTGTATVAGASTLNSTLDVVGATTMASTLDVDGQSTHASMNVEDLTATRITFAGTNGELEDDGAFTFVKGTGTMTLVGDAHIDNLHIDGNDVTATTGDDINMNVSATGTVRVPAGYEFNANFGNQSLANKAYVDNVAQGLDVKEAVRAASVVNLTATYSEPNLTGSGVLVVDGVTMAAGDRVLVMNQTNPIQNGIYVVVTADGTTWDMIRAVDANSDVATADNAARANEMTGGSFVFVKEGATLDNNGFVATHDGTPTLGTDPITFQQFSGAGMIIAGEALSKSGNTLDVEVDDTTIEVTADALNVKDLGIQNQHIADTTIDLTAKVVNQLDVINGGTGLASVVKNGILFGDDANDLQVLPPAPNDPTAPYYLRADANGVPTWSNVIDGGTY